MRTGIELPLKSSVPEATILNVSLSRDEILLNEIVLVEIRTDDKMFPKQRFA